MYVPLTAGWTVRPVAGDVPARLEGLDQRGIAATVPGSVHLDLLAAGVIPDPYVDDNERAVAWVGRVDWRYETVFDWDGEDSGQDDDQVDLVALGLDTVASVELNGAVVSRTANMHRSYRFPVAELLRPGRNELAVTFTAGLDAAEAASTALGPRPHGNLHPYNAIRKMACSFGWDWGPELVTAGIWRPIGLESWHGARLAAVRPLVDVEGSTGRLTVHVDVQRAVGDEVPVSLAVHVAGSRTDEMLSAGESSAELAVDVADVELWWPHGYGGQRLYPVTVHLSRGPERLDSWEGRVGFRTVTLDDAPDEHGTPFALRVNGTAVFARGVNWIPDDCFLPRVTRGRYAERLTQARGANANLVRVWGGGTYESEDFYDLCDELGLLVWQDFPFACAAYAEEEPLRGEVVAEAREAVTRLSPHPSLVLWNGCNESVWDHQDRDWSGPLGDQSWGWGYYADILPSIVAELDPTRPYSLASPYSLSPERHPNDPAHGTMHIWDVWNRVDYTTYRDYAPRFVAEFGFQGPPAWATLIRAIHDQPLASDSPGLLLHQKAEDGNGKLARGLRPHLPAPTSFDDWHWATSLNQARAVAFGVEHFRSLMPLCMGAVVWQLNDCWPVTSWAAVDGDGRAKPLWYALRRSFRDRLLTVQPRGDGLALVAVNDSGEPWTGSVEVTRRGMDGAVLAATTLALSVPPRGVATVPLPPGVARPADPAGEVLLADGGHGGQERAWWHFAEDVDARLPEPDLHARAEAIEGGYRLTVSARSFIRDLAVLADRVASDAVVDDMLVTLLPGETAVIEIHTASRVDPARFIQPLVLRSAGQLLHPPTPGSPSAASRAIAR
jgi:beta-mannosidase